MRIPVLVYGDAFQWEKYGHHILPSNLDLTSHHKTGIHQLFWSHLIDFLRTDLDGNLVPSSLDLTSHNKPGLPQTFQKSCWKKRYQLSSKSSLTLTGILTSLLKHTTEDPAPGCLRRRRIVKMIHFKLWVLYFHIRNPCTHMLPNMLPIA
jgi:hypothetical protein